MYLNFSNLTVGFNYPKRRPNVVQAQNYEELLRFKHRLKINTVLDPVKNRRSDNLVTPCKIHKYKKKK